MSAAPRRAATLAAAALLLALLAPGCGREEAERPASERFRPMTSGSPEAMLNHIQRLGEIYKQSEASSPADAREQLSAFIQAALDTTSAVIADRSAPEDQRVAAADLHFRFLARRSELDPESIDKSLAECDRIAEANPKSRVGGVAALERARLRGFQYQSASLADKKARIEPFAKAVLAVAALVPPQADAPDLLNKTALEAEFSERLDLARSLYQALVDRFPDAPPTIIAKNALARLDLMGKRVDDLKGPGLGGKETGPEQFRGQVVLMDFWGTGCTPCVEEIPEIEAFRTQHEAEGFRVVGMCLDPDSATSEEVVTRQKLAWPQIFAPAEGQTGQSPIALRLGIQRYPFKMVLDRDGNLVATGYILDQVKPAILAELAKKPSPAAAPANPIKEGE